MPACGVHGCTARLGEVKGIRFFKTPKVVTHEGEETQKLLEERRRLWKAAVNRTDLMEASEERWDRLVVCSKHFVNGVKAYKHDRTSPSWLPTLHMHSDKLKNLNKMSPAQRDFAIKTHRLATSSTAEKTAELGEELRPDWDPSLHMETVSQQSGQQGGKRMETRAQSAKSSGRATVQLAKTVTNGKKQKGKHEGRTKAQVAKTVTDGKKPRGQCSGRTTIQLTKTVTDGKKQRGKCSGRTTIQLTKTVTDGKKQRGKRRGRTEAQLAKTVNGKHGGKQRGTMRTRSAKSTQKTSPQSVKVEPEDSCEVTAEPEASSEVPEPPSIDMTLRADVYSSWRTIGVMEELPSDSHIAQFLVALYYSQQRKGCVGGGCAACHCPLTLYCTACQCPSPLSPLPTHSSSIPTTCPSPPSLSSPPPIPTPLPSLSSPPPIPTLHSSMSEPPPLTHPPAPSMPSSTHHPRPVMMYRSHHVLSRAPPPEPATHTYTYKVSDLSFKPRSATATTDLTPALSQQHTEAGKSRAKQDTTLVEIKLEPQEEESETVHWPETLHDSAVTAINGEQEEDDIEGEKCDIAEEEDENTEQKEDDDNTAEKGGDEHIEREENGCTESSQGCKDTAVNDFPVSVGSLNQDSGKDGEASNLGKRKTSSAVNTTCASQLKRRKVTSDGITEAVSCSEGARKTAENDVVLAQNRTTTGPQKTAEENIVPTQNIATACPQKTAENVLLVENISAAGQHLVHLPHKEKNAAACENSDHPIEEHGESTACEAENPEDGFIIPLEMRRSALIHAFDNMVLRQREIGLEYVTVKVSENTYKMMTREAYVAELGGDKALDQRSESSAEWVVSDEMLRYPVKILISGKRIPELISEGGCPLPHYHYTHYECLHCNKAFSKKKFFNTHVQTHLRTCVYKCTLCSKTFKDIFSLRDHKRRHKLVCRFCGRNSYDMNDHDNHTRLHTENNGVIKCLACPYQTTDYYKSITHKSYCNAQRNPQQCEICGVVVKTVRGLKYHILAIHKNERPYKCTKCDKGFVLKCYRSYHMKRVHSDKSELPHKCTMCDKGFIYKFCLINHIKHSHSEGRKIQAQKHKDSKSL